MLRRLFVVGLLPSLLLACATHRAPGPVPEALLLEDPFDPRYKMQCDNVSGKTICVMTGNALRPFNPRYPMLSLGLVSEAEKTGPPRYFFRTVFVNEKQWLNIDRGKTLYITIDGETYDFFGVGSHNNRYTGEREKLYEIALYETSAAIIKKIAQAKKVSVRLTGAFILEKSFGTVNNLYFQQFLRHYIEKTPAANQ